MHCIIGSGPAGVACAKALARARRKRASCSTPDIEPEPGRANGTRPPVRQAPNLPRWDPNAMIACAERRHGRRCHGRPAQAGFCLDFPYRETEQKIPWRNHGTGLKPSLALGGLSNVWGAAMLPYRDDDVANWPVKNSDLAQHYRAIAEITGFAAQRDDLEEIFPLHCENPGVLRSSRQADLLFGNLKQHRDQLRGRGWHFGRARVAVRAADNAKGDGCVHCGFCMYGCPYGCIYNSAETVSRIARGSNNFQYQRDVIVTQAARKSRKGFHHRLSPRDARAAGI